MAADWVRGKAAPFVFIPYFVPGWLPGGHGALVAPVRVEEVAARAPLMATTTEMLRKTEAAQNSSS